MKGVMITCYLQVPNGACLWAAALEVTRDSHTALSVGFENHQENKEILVFVPIRPAVSLCSATTPDSLTFIR